MTVRMRVRMRVRMQMMKEMMMVMMLMMMIRIFVCLVAVSSPLQCVTSHGASTATPTAAEPGTARALVLAAQCPWATIR
eukprot:8497548-Pyramimonas_sp.AAC.1